jgi:hypothetical protein
MSDMTSAERRQLIQPAKMRAKQAEREAETREKRSMYFISGSSGRGHPTPPCR